MGHCGTKKHTSMANYSAAHKAEMKRLMKKGHSMAAAHKEALKKYPK
tara:strand:+ start:888 stop:1028 length:141 start_codon:yes stop_codon:yes gene_type:complete